jgi:hypothetical protein
MSNTYPEDEELNRKAKSLHEMRINTDGSYPEFKTFSDFPDPSMSKGRVSFHYRDLAKRLKNEINKADFVLGAVAWLTDFELLDALGKTPYGCAMLVQKEDFLRSDRNSGKAGVWEKQLRSKYDSLKSDMERHQLPGVASSLSYCGCPKIEPVRCVGNHNSQKSAASPRMHNKFAVFCKVEKRTESASENGVTDTWEEETILPYAYWTGSFNWSRNAGLSFENAVLVYDEEVARAAATEWSNIFALSEPLDWETPWVSPEYRFGS